MVPLKTKMKSFRVKNYRTVLWQLSLKSGKIPRREVFKIISIESLHSVLQKRVPNFC